MTQKPSHLCAPAHQALIAGALLFTLLGPMGLLSLVLVLFGMAVTAAAEKVRRVADPPSARDHGLVLSLLNSTGC
jgi:hypothetical protein